MLSERPSPPRHVVVVADLAGGEGYHVGDEAMAEANVAMLREAGGEDLTITVTSADPAWTAAKLGCAAVPWVGFAECDDDRQRLRLLADRDTARAIADTPLLAAVADADAVIISGGGNINSQWPEHLFERALVGRTARRHHIPVLITGQTIGPRLDGVHRDLTAELLVSAHLVGVREPHSAALATELGVGTDALMIQADDSLGLRPAPPDLLPDGFDPGSPDTPKRFIAVTVHPIAAAGDPLVATVARQLAEVADRVGAQLLYVPHVPAAVGPLQRGDTDIAHEMARLSGGWVLEGAGARGARWASAAAWLVVATRYHPVVFATAEATPALALPSDHYTAVKSLGALGHVGLGGWHLNVPDVVGGRLAAAVGEMAARRGELAGWLRDAQSHLRRLETQRQARVLAGVGLRVPEGEPRDGTFDPVTRPDAPRPAGSWVQG